MGVKVITNLGVKDITTKVDEEGNETFTGFELSNGTLLEAHLVIFAIGIKPRDELAAAGGIACHERGGIIVDDDLQTSGELPDS